MAPTAPAFEVLRNLYGFFEPTCVLPDEHHGPQVALESVSLLPRPTDGERVLIRWTESGGISEFLYTNDGWRNVSRDEGIHAP